MNKPKPNKHTDDIISIAIIFGWIAARILGRPEAIPLWAVSIVFGFVFGKRVPSK